MASGPSRAPITDTGWSSRRAGNTRSNNDLMRCLVAARSGASAAGDTEALAPATVVTTVPATRAAASR